VERMERHTFNSLAIGTVTPATPGARARSSFGATHQVVARQDEKNEQTLSDYPTHATDNQVAYSPPAEYLITSAIYFGERRSANSSGAERRAPISLISASNRFTSIVRMRSLRRFTVPVTSFGAVPRG
jgi:hypothetical protein